MAKWAWMGIQARFNARKPKVPEEGRNDWLRLDEIKALLDAAAQSPFAERDFALMLTMVLPGLRPSETAGLLVGDVEFVLERVRIHHWTKRDEDYVSLPDNLAEALYLQHPVRASQSSVYVFLTDDNRPFTSESLREHVKALSRAAGLSRAVTPNQFRHSSATLFYFSGASLVDIQQLLRHKHLKTSRVYTHGIDHRQPLLLHNRAPERVLASWLRGTMSVVPNPSSDGSTRGVNSQDLS